VDRGRTATKRHLITDGQGLPLAVALTAANVNDYAQLLPLLDGLEGPPVVAGCQVLADRGYDAKAVREGINARGFEARVSRRNRPGEGRKRDSLARERSVIERTFAWLGSLRRLATRWERDDELYLAFLLLGCAIVCWRHLDRSL
jgi:transposase